MPLSGARHNWNIIQQHIENYTKLKYTIALLYDFLYRFKSHMYFHKNTMNIDKFEYISIIKNISNIQNELTGLKQVLHHKKLYIYTDTTKIVKLIEVYTSILYLIEKYGASNIINTINYYLLLYCEIVNLYHLYKHVNPAKQKMNNSNAIFSGIESSDPYNATTSIPETKTLPNCNNKVQIKTQFTSVTDKLSTRLSSSLPNEDIYILAHNSKMASITSSVLPHHKQNKSSNTNHNNLNSTFCTGLQAQNVNSTATGVRLNSKPTPDGREFSVSCTDSSSTEECTTDDETQFSFDMQNTNEFNNIPNLKRSHLMNTNTFGFDNPILSESLQPILNMYHTWLLKVSKQKYINSFNTLNGTLLRNIYRPNRTINNQYLDLMANCIKPFEMNIFLKQGTNIKSDGNCTIHDLFEQLTELEKCELLKSRHLCRVNYDISKIYKSIIQKIENLNSQNINFSNIQNTNILVNIKNYEYIKDNILHVFICIPITTHNKLIFVINGYIENQDVMISQKYTITAQKYEIITKQITSIEDLSMSFKKMFLKTLTLKQILCSANNDIIKCCYEKWTQYTTIMSQSISDMITHFLKGNTHKKIEILSCLLYNYKNNEAVFRAQMLWNLILDESNAMKQRNDSTEHEIINCMHPELLIYLNHITSYEYGNITENCENMSKYENEQTVYETRIAQSNTDMNIKQKMRDKLKELTNKNNDNNSKPQQYLDGILNIPFGKIAKESIICENDNYIHTIKQYISNLIIVCLDLKDTYSSCKELLDLLIKIFGLEMNILALFSNELDTETYIFTKLANYSIKMPILGNILDIFNKFIHDKLTVSADTIDTLYLITFLKEISTTEQNDICQLYNNQNHIINDNNITFNTIIRTLESNDISINGSYNHKQLKTEIISILANESYFYDTGIPDVLIHYKEKLLILLDQNKQLITKKKEYLANCYKQLDKSIHGQSDAKDQIIRIIGQWLNGHQSGYCIGFEGAPGVGKTSLAKYGIANALIDESGKGRPFGFIALGGSSNGSTLEGHSYTYVGSTWGRIVDIIMTSGVMNPIIFIDELDKISNTESGREIIGILTHITDKTQNMEFMDKYFAGVKIDLSQVLFIFSYNDYGKLDSILADRIHRIKFDNYSVNDKITICNNYLVPKILDEINITDFECSITHETLRYIIESYTYEAGVRRLKEKLYDILREINVKYIKGELTYDITNASIRITPELVDTILNSYYKVEIPKTMDTPQVGVVYGLYATAMGTGGITIIQVTKKYTDSSSLVCTGKPGDVMLESMKVSLTLAINMLSPDILAKWGISHSGEAGKFGIHIHCPDGATPKDGPSAGCAFTVALFSLLMDTPVLNTVSMTGEIDIMGNVLPIGGLDSKIQGSTRSGINTVLVPIDNKKDICQIQRRQPEILNGVNIIYTKTVKDVLKYSLVSNNESITTAYTEF